MNKIVLGIVLGGLLGIFDGLTAWLTPEVRNQMIGIVVGSTVKGIIAGVLTGVFARHRAVRGEEVGLRLEPDGCHLFPADAPGGEGSPAAADAGAVRSVTAVVGGAAWPGAVQ